jgi:hypothetical protein
MDKEVRLRDKEKSESKVLVDVEHGRENSA